MDAVLPAPALAAPPRTARTLQLKRATDFLSDTTRIGTYYVNYPRCCRRYVDLKKQELFDALVELYTQVIATYWDRLERLTRAHPPPQAYADRPIQFLAANYISSWFLDLYVSNRYACKKLSDTAYTEHYFLDKTHKSMEYDVFLTAVNAQIRPTNIKFNHENTSLFIPRITPRIVQRAAEENHFSITGWTFNPYIVQGLIFNFRDKKLLHMEALSETSIGRPSWLFDWHNDGLAYAWFPSEGNYNMDDVSIAYIVGGPCTPKLAPRDYDEWQLLPGNVFPNNINNILLNRIRPISYHGPVEVRAIETRTWRFPTPYRQSLLELNSDLLRTLSISQQQGDDGAGPKRTRAATERETRCRTTSALASQSQIQLSEGDDNQSRTEEPEEEEAQSLAVPATHHTQTTTAVNRLQFTDYCEARIVDYLYHAQVVRIVDPSSRQAAHRLLSYTKK